ncbi:MAG: hypothetical protein ABIF01_02850 [Candidatus Micrarchaeota archaeon]
MLLLGELMAGKGDFKNRQQDRERVREISGPVFKEGEIAVFYLPERSKMEIGRVLMTSASKGQLIKTAVELRKRPENKGKTYAVGETPGGLMEDIWTSRTRETGKTGMFHLIEVSPGAMRENKFLFKGPQDEGPNGRADITVLEGVVRNGSVAKRIVNGELVTVGTIIRAEPVMDQRDIDDVKRTYCRDAGCVLGLTADRKTVLVIKPEAKNPFDTKGGGGGGSRPGDFLFK